MVNGHSQVPVKVNAWVDEGIAPVVQALAELPEVVSFSSCQGDGHVHFWVEGSSDDLFRQTCEIASTLAAEVALEGFEVRIQWVGETPAHGSLYVSADHFSDVAAALRRLSSRRMKN